MTNERVAMRHLLAVGETVTDPVVAHADASGDTDRLQRRIQEAKQLLDPAP